MRKLFRSRKAVSGILGGVFLVTMIFLATNVAIWYYGQQANLQAQSRMVAQLQRDRKNEQFVVQFLLIGSDNTLNGTLQNVGPVAVHIVDLIVTQTTAPTSHHIYPVSYYIDPGSTLTNVGRPTQIPAIFNPSNSYTVTFITERGNGVVSGYSPTTLTNAPYATFSSLGYLSIAFSPNSVQYTSSGVSIPASVWAIANSATTICSTNVMFWVTFTNHGSYNAIMLQWSVLELFHLQSGSVDSHSFYIVASSSTYNSFAAYNPNSPVTIPTNPSGNLQVGGTATVVKFASTQIEGSNGQTLGSLCGANQIYDMFIMATYTYNGQQYNQLIPFAGMVLTS